jgi:antitoxin VapB
MHKARLFTNGRSQAIRIPQAIAFEGVAEVTVRREGDRVILEPVRKSWTSFSAQEPADDDFLSERPELLESGRVRF